MYALLMGLKKIALIIFSIVFYKYIYMLYIPGIPDFPFNPG